ncbi:MAG: hypothetical protein Q4F17_02735 [Eubacteriales bacterium]|nr:hypothetical protein [Eubacteriales bacterium]
MNIRASMWMLLGNLLALALFTLGDLDDAPGLSFLGLAGGFLLVMRGIYHLGILRKGHHIPVILLVFGVVAVLFPLVLFLDGEIEGLSLVTFIGETSGTAMLLGAWYLLRKGR